MLLIYCYLFIGFITGFTVLHLLHAVNDGVLDDDEIFSDATFKELAKIVCQDKAAAVVTVCSAMIIWPYFWISCGIKATVVLIAGFVVDMIKGHY